MNITYTSIESSYTRHVRLARKACKGLSGYKRAEAIKGYFSEKKHPHAQYTFEQMAMNRSSDSQFAIELLQSMANLCALNEEGYTVEGVNGLWHFEKLIGDNHFNSASVNLYSLDGDNSKQLVTVEYDNKVHGYMVFDSIESYTSWVDDLMKPYNSSGLTMMWQIANTLDPSWSTESND
jgi:hypothetical protein